MTEPTHLANADLGLRHVFLRDLTLQASVGIHPGEHRARQRIRINVDLAVRDEGGGPGGQPSIGRDELARVVDYEALAIRVRAIIDAGHVRLLETLAERVAEAALADTRVAIARIRIEKLDIFADAASVGVEIERRRR